ncbi:MAG: metallophosphoesterase family protein [Phycisphaerae bacterium]
MRHLAVGDVHGCFTALRTLAAFVPLGSSDVLVMLGDYVDRGPDSCAVLDWLIDRERRGTLVALRGNHELMMLNAREDPEAFRRWMEYGAAPAPASYSPVSDSGRLQDVPDSHWKFLEERTRPWYQTDAHFFVHANAFPGVPLEEQPDLMLYWELWGDPSPHESGKVMVCGHTPQRSGVPKDIGHAVCIDTLAWDGGWLTCLDAASGAYWQANQKGETRRSRL